MNNIRMTGINGISGLNENNSQSNFNVSLFKDRQCQLKGCTLNVAASKFESMHGAWVEKGECISFRVSGVWKKDKSGFYVNYKGEVAEHQSSKNVELVKFATGSTNLTNRQTIQIEDHGNSNEDSFREGELLCRILGGEYFSVARNIEYVAETSGPIFFKMHLKDMTKNPIGQLMIYIRNCQKVSFEEIEIRLGWDLFKLDTGLLISNLVINSIERNLLIMINKLRTNPKLFAQQYLENIRTLGPITRKLYDKIITDQEIPLEPFRLNKKINNFVKSLPLQSPESSKAKTLKYLRKFPNVEFFIQDHSDRKHLSILIRLLFNEKLRQAILNQPYGFISISAINRSESSNKAITTIMVICSCPSKDFSTLTSKGLLNDTMLNPLNSSRNCTEVAILNQEKKKANGDGIAMKRYYSSKDLLVNRLGEVKEMTIEEAENSATRKSLTLYQWAVKDCYREGKVESRRRYNSIS